MGYGDRLKNARNKAGLTQEGLKNQMGWQSQGVVSKYENEVSEPSIGDFEKLGAILNVSASWLAFGIGYTPTSARTVRIELSRVYYDGDQAHQLWDDIPGKPTYFLAAQCIAGYVFHEDEKGRPVINVHTTIQYDMTDREPGISLIFEKKDGEYQRIRRELEECFTTSADS